jgi:hypothetical protein
MVFNAILNYQHLGHAAAPTAPAAGQ